MLTGEIRSQINAIWDSFWSGGISNPLEVMEQITYLLFIRRLDEMHTLEEQKAIVTGKPQVTRIFPLGKDEKGRDYNDLRWSRFKNFAAPEMYTVVGEHVFPFLRVLGGQDTTYAHHMKDARFTIPTPGLLAKVVDMLDRVPMDDLDTKGDVYEYMLGKIASAGQNGQFRTPRHIIKLMVALTEPNADDVICDPASGTCGFLVAASEYLRATYPKLLNDASRRNHFHSGMFHGYDFDNTMLRIGNMNMVLHGVENPDIRYKDSLAQDHAGDEEKYSLLLANPPFSGSLDYENTAKDLLSIVRTRKTELLFMALFLRLLKPGGRAAVIVPAGVIESDSAAHKTLRKKLIEENRLEGIISLPHWVFKPYASVATAILIFGKSGKTEKVWFYRIDNDGYNNDAIKSTRDGSELPKLVDLWKIRHEPSYEPQQGKHRFVSREEIQGNDYDLCDRVYLSGYQYPSDVPLRPLHELFDIYRGTVGATQAVGGDYTCVTTSEESKRHTEWNFDGEAICVPIVSSTGHGHASIKRIHYVSGKFSAATITAVMLKKKGAKIHVPYVYHYLSAHKDELLVPLMRGAANVSLNEGRLGNLRIPVPCDLEEQKRIVEGVVQAKLKIESLKEKLAQAEKNFDEKFADLRNSF
ncbi:N-6 DNA methylase [Burkholderia cenocepacia]|uniref:N-6 DNA methylase n=1 Tax=Burkholderia cenocepacia TaxID=95486 RepID=UPI000D0C29D9|nr:N-6 DNA methylase [Burkholderia cenocepacia]SOT46204.1 N-6 adenine-specific DNA methylase 3 [Burkholderia cenocepacia]